MQALRYQIAIAAATLLMAALPVTFFTRVGAVCGFATAQGFFTGRGETCFTG